MKTVRSLIVGALSAVAVCGMSALPAAAGEGAPTTPPTFAREILPILQQSCQECHRPGQMAPMSLLTYEEVRPWSRSIKQRVTARSMPPWHADRTIGEYDSDPSLSDEQIATIASWVDGGSPLGDPKAAPPPRAFPAAGTWTFGEEPDLVITAPATTVPAGGADLFPVPEVASGLTEDRYVKWMQVVPENPAIVHHTMVYVAQGASVGASPGSRGGAVAGTGERRQLAEGQQVSLLVLYGKGSNGDLYPEGQAKLLQAGSTLRFESHFHPNGEAVTERTKVGIKFYPKGYQPKTLMVSRPISVKELEIPPGDPNARHDGYFTLNAPARLVSFLAHMHYRGKRMELEAILPSGQVRLLTDINRFNWSWQLRYSYKNPITVPRGTVLHVISFHDNSTANRENPDATAFVGYGDRTIDEMGVGWVDYYSITDQEYLEIQQKERLTTSTDQGQ